MASTVKKTRAKNKEKKLTKKGSKENSPNVMKTDVDNSENESSSNKEFVEPEKSEKELNQQDPPASVTESSTSDKKQPKSRKRRAATNIGENKASDKTKTKKQKVVSEVPEISSITGKVFVTGDNSVGQLGFNSDDVMEKKRPVLLEMPYSIVDIAAGGMHSVCLTQTGEVITFGLNDEGALGRVTEDGTEYIPQKVDIPQKIVQISAGDSHSAALSESGEVFIWGNFRNNNGVMGLITPGLKQTLPVQILRDVTIVKISSGSDHLSCLSSEGIVYTCGNGEAGQLGRVSERTSETGGRQGMDLLLCPKNVSVRRTRDFEHITDVWTGSLATFIKSNNGIIYGFGLNNYGQLGLDPDQNRVIWKPQKIDTFKKKNWAQINSGQHHTLALDNEGFVYSLGRHDYGRLGLGENAESVSEPTKITTLEEKPCRHISCGDSASFALENNGGVYSWGFGTNFQLGHGNDDDQYVPKLIEGNFHNSWKALKISGGAQHTLILAHPRNSNEESQ